MQFTSVGRRTRCATRVATGEFVVAICTEGLAEQVNATGTDYPPDVSEFDACGLTRLS